MSEKSAQTLPTESTTTDLNPKYEIQEFNTIPAPDVKVNIEPILPYQTIRHDHYTHPKQPELKIEVSRGQKGSYGWTITYNGTDLEAVIEKIREADAKLRELFLGD